MVITCCVDISLLCAMLADQMCN
uniref:Uncharacterized protein n=1 Tax=Arundo donax TaxID=35708 RepID=A0A0A8YWD7_ARUDO